MPWPAPPGGRARGGFRGVAPPGQHGQREGRAVPGTPPAGEPAPRDGSLPDAATVGLAGRPFGIYVHVPFCQTRCGYCDFNTYTAAELGGGASRESYAGQAAAELSFARRVLGPGVPPVVTVFLGGGTPTLLPPDQLGGLLTAIDGEFGLAPGCE